MDDEPRLRHIEITADAAAVIAALAATPAEVNHDGVYVSGKVYGEIRRAFPLEWFHRWVADDQQRYDPNATASQGKHQAAS